MPDNDANSEAGKEKESDGFGPVSVEPLSRIQKLVARKMVRACTSIPQVTHFDEVDITELLQLQRKDAAPQATRLSLNAWLARACVLALKAHPRFCASLDEETQSLILKHYINLGIAVDSPHGLVVATLFDAHQKNATQLDEAIRDLVDRASRSQLTPADMEGSCFTISNLGRNGGTGFTPIVNIPEVAILGVSRTQPVPRFVAGIVQERALLPLALTYDHRVINGVDAARFCSKLRELLESPGKLC